LLENLLVEKYIAGRLPLPDPILQGILNVSVESYYRFGKRLEAIPRKWDGEQGGIAPDGGATLMDVHYDLPAAIFERFLGRTMKYSMALWDMGAKDLDSAQDAMLADVCKKVDMRDGLTLLDIGCGFGSFASHVLKNYPQCSVLGLTLSDAQYSYMMEKQKELGHPLNTERFRVAKEDFGKISLHEKFDRIVSIGVFEHLSNLRLALAKIRGLLKDNGACLLHYIVYTKLIERFADFDMRDTFMCHYIFPNSRFWHDRELFKYQDDFSIDQYWFLNGSNYQLTLEAWLKNFRANWDQIQKIIGSDDEKFYRIWNYYLRFTRALFKGQGGKQVGNGQYLLHAK
jgi:cyclopropane-fatty-acyl-phospholipid synthase